MKTKNLMWGLLIGALSLANCTKDDTDNGFESAENSEKLITRTLTVSDEAWDEVRSSYEPGVGIRLDGTEHLSVYYSVSGTTSEAGSKTLGYKLLGVVDGAPTGDGNYTFSHPEVTGAEAYDYFFMMPYLPTSKLNSAGTASYHRIGPVQMPKAATFDPNFDYIVGKPALDVAAADQNTVVTRFKRLMAPLRLKFTDNAGVLAGQKIRQVTIGFSAATDKAENRCMSGLFYFQYSEEAAECHVSGWENGSFSNAATADYPAGLEQDGTWETWLMVNPVELEACDMTIDVVSDKMRITRTVPTNKVFNITKDAINVLSFDISGNGYTAESAYSVDFTEYTKVPTTIAASDGYTYDWTLANCTFTVQPELGNALRLKNTANNGSITLPELPEGASYKAIYLTENTNNTSKKATVVCKQGELEAATGTFGYYEEVSQQGGVLKLDIPAEYARGPLTIEHDCTDALWINRMTVTYEGELHPIKPQQNYSDIYEAGGDIVIGSLVINKTTFPTAKVVDIATVNNKTFTDGGLVFLDGEGSYTMTTSPSIHTDLILIGNDPEKQPTIVCKGASTYYFAVRGEDCDYVFKNLNIDGSSNNYLFSNTDNANASGKIKSLTIEDCTMSTNGNVIQDGNSTNSMQNVAVRNCIVRMPATGSGKAVYGWVTGKTDTKATDQLATVTLTDNVIYASSPASHYLVMVGGKAANVNYDSNATIVVERNSTYNIYHGNGMVSAYSAADMQVNYNVSEFDDSTLAKNSYSSGYSKPNDPKKFTVTNNYAFTNSGETQRWKAFWKNTEVTATVTTKNNSFTLQESPFVSANTETGYFPVNTSVVTNGAGASYDTKLWNKWE